MIPRVVWSSFSLLLLLVSSAQGQAQPGAKVPPGPVASLDLCLAATADASCVNPTRVLRSPATDVVLVYQISKGEYQRLTARLIVLDVGGAIPANTAISTNDMKLTKEAIRGVLGFKGPVLPIGKYRVDVLTDGKPWKSIEFAVTAGKQ